MTDGTKADVERVKRMARLLDDAVSQDLLKRYLRDVEYDMAYGSARQDRRVTI